jgi:SAM-dependent methyltransferase
MKTLVVRALFMVFFFIKPGLRRNGNAVNNGHQKNLELVRRYLHGLRGIEIGASGKKYGLDNQQGAYANVDVIDAHTRARNKGWKESQLVNILSSGDDLPFKDGVFDYVFSSHVIEHFFDPIRAIREWFRVVREGGYVFMIIPHKERTYDRNREMTHHAELMERHRSAISHADYIRRTEEARKIHESHADKGHHRIHRHGEVPAGWERLHAAEHDHHWSVWDTQAFLDLCREHGWKVEEVKDIEGYTGNDFTVILRK